MPDEQTLLTAIIARPEDDAPRLAYADWLDRQGGAANKDRAEYIRLEIDLARIGSAAPSTPELQAHRKRSRELFAKHYREWFPAFVGRTNLLRRGRPYIEFKRGFPALMHVQTSKLLEVGEELFGLAPITFVDFRSVTDGLLRKLVQAPWIAQLRKIELDSASGRALDWAPLADCPYLGHLHELILYQGTLTLQGAARLAKENPCRRLRRLRLSSLSLSDDAVRRLFAGPAFTSLEELDFGGDQLTLKGAQTVAAAPALKRLKSLRISSHPLPGIAKVIAKATFWPAIQHLEVRRCALGDAGLRDLINGGPSRLKTLRLDNNDITAVGIRSLAESRLLRTLTALGLWGNEIGDAGLSALARSPNAKQLRKLDLFGCKFGAEGMQALAASPNLARLLELHIGGNNLGAQEAKVFAASPYLGNLTKLQIGYMTAAGRKHLKGRFGNIVSF